MKVTIENKKGLNKDIKVFVAKKLIISQMEDKYEELKKSVTLKGFRPGKVPVDILKKQFGKVVYGEVLEKILKETSTKAIEEKKKWKDSSTSKEWKINNLKEIQSRLNGWQLESFKESYKHKIENGISLIKKKELSK